MKEEPNIDELLNSFLDGELTPRQQTEVQRLIKHDTQAAQRLRQLQKCKILVGSLPHDEAPEDMLDTIKASLERRALLGHQSERFEQRNGARELFARKIFSVAAMVGLVAVLGIVVYTIVAPESVPKKTVVAENPPQLVKPTQEMIVENKIDKTSIPAARFYGRLELKTGDLTAVDAFIRRAIEGNGITEYGGFGIAGDRSTYTFNCSTQTLNLLLADLETVWAKFGSASLFVQAGEDAKKEVAVAGVNTRQIADIVNQNSTENCIRVAGNFAALNNVTNLSPGSEILTALAHNESDLITVPKPALTSGEKVTGKTPHTDDSNKVHLTIVITLTNNL